MANLQMQTILSSELASRRILLRPPEPAPSDLLGIPGEGIYIGNTQMLNVPVYWNFRTLANPHLAVVGMTGSGKSYFIKAFITRAYRTWGTSSLILDWAGEYAPWVERAGGKVVKLSIEGINILDCRQAEEKNNSKPATPRSQIERVIGALCILTDLSSHPRKLGYIQDAMKKAYERKKLNIDLPVKKSGASKLPTLKDVYSILNLKLKKENSEELSSACHLIEQFCTPGSDYFSKAGGIQLDSLIGKGVVSVDLSSLPSDMHRSLAGLVILQFVKERMRDEGWSSRKQLKLIVVADEAWKLAQDERSDLVQIMREGRKYAFALIVASQNPSDISKTILSNAATLAIFRIMHFEYRESLLKSINCAPDVSIQMERFEVGQALFRLAWEKPGAYDGPFIISKIAGEEEEPVFILGVESMQIKIERGEFKKRLWRLGCTNSQISQLSSAFEQNDFSLDVENLAMQLTSFGFSRSTLLSFLRDIGVEDSDLLKLFSRLQARSLGVPVSEIANLVIKDDKAPKIK